MPSTTARAGGIFLPIMTSLSKNNGSLPNDPSSRKMGAFLVQSQLQTSSHGSALFLTAAAQNLLCLKLASELGVEIPSTPEAPAMAAEKLEALGPMSRDELTMAGSM